MTTKFRNNGVTRKLREFFEANPDEELEVGDLVKKFEVSERTMRNAVWSLKAQGFIKRSLVYRLNKDAE